MKARQLLIGLLILSLMVFTSFQCHYTCLQCSEDYFTDCMTCYDNKSVSYQITYVEQSKGGTCANMLSKFPNFMGLFLLTFSFSACLILGGEKIYSFIFLIQNLGLIFLIEIYWTKELDYVLQAMSYFMVFSYLSYPLKNGNYTFRQGAGYKNIFFLKSSSLSQNMIIIGPFVLIVFLLMLITPLYLSCRANVPRRWLPDWKLQKIGIAFCTLYFLTIQEMLVIIFIGLTYNQNKTPSDYIITGTYFLSLLIFFIYLCKCPLPYFRNKYSLLLILLSRIVGPFFILANKNFHWIFYLLTFLIFLFEIIATNQNKDQGKTNRLLLYKFGFLLAYCSTLLYYIIETKLNQSKISKPFSIISLIAICFFLSLYILEVVLELKQDFCPDLKLNDTTTTQESLEPDGSIQNNKKVHAVSYPFEPFRAVLRQKQSINNSLTLMKSSQEIIDFSQISVEPNIIFDMPHDISSQKPKERVINIKPTLQQKQCTELFAPTVVIACSKKKDQKESSSKQQKVQAIKQSRPNSESFKQDRK